MKTRPHYAWTMLVVTFLYAMFSTSAMGVPAIYAGRGPDEVLDTVKY